MKKIAKAIIQRAFRNVRAWKARLTIDKLISHESPKLNAIGHALRETLDNVTSQEEQRLVSLIENRRLSLLKSDASIAVIDYGAGSRDSNRTEEEMRIGVQSTASVSKICGGSKPAFWALFLFKLIRKLKPNSCLELGSCVGISASYLAAALRLNKKGKLLTLEGSPETAKIAKETLIGLELGNASVIIGPFHETYKNALESAKPVDFLFNDGHHDHDALLKYFFEALPYLAEETIIVFDDISWSPGMQKAWTEIENDERVAMTIDLRTMGIAVISNKESVKSSFSIPL
jgi:predicted O-methyltransferase YrrM